MSTIYLLWYRSADKETLACATLSKKRLKEALVSMLHNEQIHYCPPWADWGEGTVAHHSPAAEVRALRSVWDTADRVEINKFLFDGRIEAVVDGEIL